MTDEEIEIKEQGYLEGEKAVWRQLLGEAVRNLSGEDMSKEYLLKERVDVVALLRDLCAEFGDNDWEDNLHLRDVIDKHLARYLYQ